ncbi:MAG: NAD-dependent epimerase/dehydratase family protein [Acidobacteriota bacterium]|nr:NAD-dependent epimerase/dehydratase family protein [Blastocatellia bacterium]MDW8413549.1 NAD-dependent epimerase/dehydratase family protein [Acidobacteriota bacterium]
MKVLVTGGAGFIGSHLCESLLRRGDKLIIIDDLNDFYPPSIKRSNLQNVSKAGGYTFYQLDIRNAAGLHSVFECELPQTVVHLAARAGVRPSLKAPVLYEEVNVVATIHLLELCRKFRVENFIFASSSSVYGINSRLPFREDDPIDRPISPYATTKRSGELLAFNYSYLYNLNVTCLRFFTVYGPRQRPEMAIYSFTRQILSGKPIHIFGDGSSRRDYTYIDDIVTGIISAIDRPKRFAIYNLGNSSPVTLNELIETLEQACGKKAIKAYLPAEAGDVPATYAAIDLARSELGFEPTTDLQTGIARFVKWYKDGAID